MTAFIQIIEIRTGRIAEVRALVDEMRASGTGTAVRGTVTEDRDRPGYYLNIVEFDSFESAMENSARPEVSQYAAGLAALCDEPPRFYNLNVVEAWNSQISMQKGKAALAGTAAALSGVAAAALTKARDRLEERRRQQTALRRTAATTTPAETARGAEPTGATESEGRPPTATVDPTTHDGGRL